MKKSVSPRSLNTDDNKLSLQPTESKFSLNIDAEGFGEDESGVVKHVRGNTPATFSDSSMVLPAGTNKVIGSISDDQLNVIYFFVYNDQSQHSVVAYNSKTNTYRIVFKSSALEFKEDGFVKADIVRLRRVPEDQPVTYEPPTPPEVFTPVEVKFRVFIDLSVWGEMYGYKSQDPAPSFTSTLAVRFTAGGGLRLYEDGSNITDNSLSSPYITKELKASDDSADGWLKSGTVTLFVHPEDLDNAASFIEWKVQSDLGGPVSEDITRTISYETLLSGAAAPSEGVNLGQPCYGYNKSINEMMVSDLPISGIEPAIMNSVTETGRLLDRKISFKTGCDYSQTDEWEAALVSAINTYSGGEFTGGMLGGRSYPASLMDNGDDPVGPGGGGGGGGSDVVVITYCNTIESAQAVGAAYGSLAEAVAAWQDETAAGNLATIENLCQSLGGVEGSEFTPKAIVYDSLSGETSEIESLTSPDFDVALETIPNLYDFVVPMYPSSCGTMRRQTSFIFRVEPERVEVMSSSVPTNLNLYWGAPSGGVGYEFADIMSDISTSTVSQDFISSDAPQGTLMRTFEVSTNSSVSGPGLYEGTNAIQHPPVVYASAGSNVYPAITFLCFSNHGDCSVVAGQPDTIDPIRPEINGDDEGNNVTIISVTTTTDLDRPATQEDSTLSDSSSEDGEIIKAKTNIKKK